MSQATVYVEAWKPIKVPGGAGEGAIFTDIPRGWQGMVVPELADAIERYDAGTRLHSVGDFASREEFDAWQRERAAGIERNAKGPELNLRYAEEPAA